MPPSQDQLLALQALSCNTAPAPPTRTHTNMLLPPCCTMTHSAAALICEPPHLNGILATPAGGHFWERQPQGHLAQQGRGLLLLLLGRLGSINFLLHISVATAVAAGTHSLCWPWLHTISLGELHGRLHHRWLIEGRGHKQAKVLACEFKAKNGRLCVWATRRRVQATMAYCPSFAAPNCIALHAAQQHPASSFNP